jgi:hypothetical protein
VRNGKEKEEGESPTHNHLAKALMFLSGKWFGENVCPIVICIYFQDANCSLLYLISEVVVFKSNALSVLSCGFTVC